jgi:hypothetical protein
MRGVRPWLGPSGLGQSGHTDEPLEARIDTEELLFNLILVSRVRFDAGDCAGRRACKCRSMKKSGSGRGDARRHGLSFSGP